MSRIPNNRPTPSKSPPKKPRKRLPAVSKKRAVENRKYAKMREIYLEANPDCDMCDQRATELHHLARGANRAASLTNPNTLMGLCRDCHESTNGMTIEQQVSRKWWAILCRLSKYRGSTVLLSDVMQHLT